MSLSAHIAEEAASLVLGDMSGIYKITNLVNGKLYIGQAVNLRKRKATHLATLRKGRHRNKRLQASFNKHGEQAFSFSAVEYCELGELIAREQYWIDQLDVVANGYNLSPIAGKSGLGLKRPFKRLSDEHKKKIGLARIGKPRSAFSEEWCKKLSEVARRPRPSQSIAIIASWAKRERKYATLTCDGCGCTKTILESQRGRYSNNYQCRPCYLSNRRKAA